MLTRLRRLLPASIRTATLAATAVAALAGHVRAAGITTDKGNFIIYQDDKSVGGEFLYGQFTDSLTVQSRGYLVASGPNGEERYEKGMQMVLSRIDFELRSYLSNTDFRGHKFANGITLQDTMIAVFHETDQRGEGNGMIRPPGRFYVIDARIYTLIDLLCRSFKDREFKSRDVNLLILGKPDTFVTATVSDVGPETLRWGGRPVVTRRFIIEQGNLTFYAWADPQGRMLRLTEPQSGLRVEREAPAVKPAAKKSPPPKPGG